MQTDLHLWLGLPPKQQEAEHPIIWMFQDKQRDGYRNVIHAKAYSRARLAAIKKDRYSDLLKRLKRSTKKPFS